MRAWVLALILSGCLGPGPSDVVVENHAEATSVAIFIGWPGDVVFNDTIEVAAGETLVLADALSDPEGQADAVPFEVTSPGRSPVRGELDLFHADEFRVVVEDAVLTVTVG